MKGKNTKTRIHKSPIYEPLEHRFTRYPTLDIKGKGKIPEAHTFFADSHREWNINNMSVGQICQMIDMMYTEYKLMCWGET